MGAFKLNKKRAIALILVGIFVLSLFVGSVQNMTSNQDGIQANSSPSIPATDQNIKFTGNVSNDFKGDLIYNNYNTSAWGPSNNISKFYFAYNSTDLFFGFKEYISGNTLFLFLRNNTGSQVGTYFTANITSWNVPNIRFTEGVNYYGAVYIGTDNSGPSGEEVERITSELKGSNSSSFISTVSVNNNYDLNGLSNKSIEIAIPISSIYPNFKGGQATLSVAAFVGGGKGGAYVGTGIPFKQASKYNGAAGQNFTVNNFLNLTMSSLPSTITTTPVSTGGDPINLLIDFNDHQPLYKVVGSNNYTLPWAEAHATAEYIEQALILHEHPGINVTYELSGSLLDQLVNISSDPLFNDTYIQGAYIPYSNLDTPQNISMLDNLTYDYFSIPSYVFALNEPASNLYNHLHTLWESGTTLNATQFEDVKVLWFLYDISTPLIEGQLGSPWKNSTIWGMHNDTSFDQKDLKELISYSKWLTGQVIPAFKSDIRGNMTGTDNAELYTSPFYHPLTPLLLTNNLTGPDGTIAKASFYSDVMAQMNVSRGQFDHLFGEWPNGMYSPENAVSYQMIEAINESGAKWTTTAEWTLQQSGVNARDYGAGGNLTQMEALYTPYKVLGPDGTSTYVFFRDGTLSNDLSFNYGEMPTSVAVSSFINYLKGIYNTIPKSKHNTTVVTLMTDGENWMFESPYKEDGVPFLEQLYTALENNRTYIHTITPEQYIHSLEDRGATIPVLKHIATGSWNRGNGNAAPYESNPSLTQWAGDTVQDFYWETINSVRELVLNYQTEHGLTQLENYTTFEQNLTANTPEGNLTRAWNGVYAAEGSDWYFQMAPWTISSSNTIPFDYLFKGDLKYALGQLNIPIPAYLLAHYVPPITPTSMGNPMQAHSPSLSGYPSASLTTMHGVAYSTNVKNVWNGTILYRNASSSMIKSVNVGYSSTTLYVQVTVNGDAELYSTNPELGMGLYFGNPNPSTQGNISVDVQLANFQTFAGNHDLNFAATTLIELAQSTFENGVGQYSVYKSEWNGKWSYQVNDINTPAYAIQTIQFAIPLSYLGYVPGNQFDMGVYAYNLSSGESSNISPLSVQVPLQLAQYTPVSSIHNTVPANGPGNYTYPEQPAQIPPGSLDMKWANVSINSYDIKFQFTFGELANIWSGSYGFSTQIVAVYLSDGSSSGSTYLGNGPNANLTVPWQYAVQISGFSTYVQTPSGSFTQGITVVANLSDKSVTVVVPLSYFNSNILSDGFTIISGSYDGYGVNGWRVVDAVNTSNDGWQGGGGDPPWSSNIYDYIAPATVGQGSLTQQEALTYSTGHIPTLTPIKMPKISNSTSTKKVHFDNNEYNMPSILYSNGTYYMFFISNVSGQNFIYEQTSSNMISWSSPSNISGTQGAISLSANLNSSIYLAYSTASNFEIMKSSGNGSSWHTIYTKSTSTEDVSLYVALGNEYLLVSEPTTGGYNYHILEIHNGVMTREVSLSGVTTAAPVAAISGSQDRIMIAYYNGNSSNPIKIEIMSAALKNIKTISGDTTSGLIGKLGISANEYGNTWIAYTTDNGGIYSLYVTNVSTFSHNPSFMKATMIYQGSTVNENPSIFIIQHGTSDSVILSWAGQTSSQNTVWAMNPDISWVQSPISQPPVSTANYLLYYIIIAVVAIAVIGTVFVVFRKKK